MERNITLFALGSLLTLTVAGFSASRMLPEYVREPDTAGSQDVYEHKPVTSIVGEFRGTLAGFLYARADEYMHGGVIMRPATQQEIDSGARLASNGDSMRNTHGSGETSVVPEPERDARGYWGHIERDTQPFMEIRNHGHRDLKEALPLFRMMTWSDPHFIEGYNFGAFIVFSALDKDGLKRAMDFLAEGIRNNPNSYVLHTEYGNYEFINLKNLPVARDHFLTAVHILEKIPQAKINKLNDVDQQDARQAYDELVLVYRKMRDTPNEVGWARKTLQRYPYSAPACHTLIRHHLPLPPRPSANSAGDS